MPNLFGKHLSREQFCKYIGNVNQVGGVRRSVLTDGQGRGVEVIDLKTGAGLAITITAGRAMDILDATLNGSSFAWLSPVGPVHPSYAQYENEEFLRSFSGGLLTTCGLTNMGAPAEDGGEKLGLHGRLPTLPAYDVNTSCRWLGNDFLLSVEGEMREYALYGPNLRLYRRITAKLGENRIVVEDEVENASTRRQPHQILYHINLGYPLMDVGTETRLRSKKTISRETGLEAAPEDYKEFSAPNPRATQECFFHDLATDSNGMSRVAIINPKVNGGEGLALVLRFSKKTLPWLMQWRNPLSGDYVQGIEPGNGWVEGRDKDREAGRLQFLKPGESRSYTVEFEFLSGKKQLAGIRI